MRLAEYDVYFFKSHISYIFRNSVKGIDQIERVDFKFLNAHAKLQLIPVGKAINSSYYYTENRKEGLEAKNFKSVKYQNIYEGVDLHFYLDEKNQLKYDFIIEDTNSIEKIEWVIEGAKDVFLDDKNELKIATSFGFFNHQAPFTYQKNEKNRITEVISSFQQRSENIIGFNIGSFNPNLHLIIDPTISYATYYGKRITKEP
ncbi:DUF7948 domain-containing protein [Algoriphagus hitonicola]|uniref:DUF7948 domain-containing protein n=1 Tax=Algoriphagus hitonicola TaxID=435880 RepID=UPI00360F63F2